MKFDKIQFFLDVVEAGSYKNAAEQMGVSVSAVSQKIQTIEKEFSSKLVKNKNGKLELTDTGKIFMEKGHSILQDYNYALRALKSMDKFVVYIGVVSYVDPEFIVDLLKQFKKEHSDMVIRIRVEPLSSMIQKFKMGIYQALILGKTDMAKVKGYECADLFVFHPYLFIPQDHVWFERTEIQAEELCGEKVAIILEDEWPEGFHVVCSALEKNAQVKWVVVNNYQELISAVELEGILGLGYKEDWVVKFTNCGRAKLLGMDYADYGIIAMLPELDVSLREYLLEKEKDNL